MSQRFPISKWTERSKKRGNGSMPQHHLLTINVNDQLTIDARSWQACVEEDQTPCRLISPPQITMYRQVLSYLQEVAKDMKAPPKSQPPFREGQIATVAVCLRWG